MFVVPNWNVTVDEQLCLQNVRSWQAFYFLRYTPMEDVDWYVSPHKVCSECLAPLTLWRRNYFFF